MQTINLDNYKHYLKPRARDWHKRMSGHVVIVGGELGYSGAPRMAAEAAYRVGAGLVSIATRSENAIVMNATLPEVMCFGVETKASLQPLLEKASVIIIGPGLGQSAWSKDMWEGVMSQEIVPLVVDADGLNILSNSTKKNENWVLTPHVGEASRLIPITPEDIQKNRLSALTQIQKRYGGTCVLKGMETLVLSPHEEAIMCEQGNPGMATAGTGDVLSGIIGGLIAQGIPLGIAAKMGVFIHAKAGDLAAKDGERGMMATDLMPYLKQLVNFSGPAS